MVYHSGGRYHQKKKTTARYHDPDAVQECLFVYVPINNVVPNLVLVMLTPRLFKWPDPMHRVVTSQSSTVTIYDIHRVGTTSPRMPILPASILNTYRRLSAQPIMVFFSRTFRASSIN